MREDEKKEEITKMVDQKLDKKEKAKTQKEQLEFENAPKGRGGKGDKVKEEINYEELGYTEDDVPDLE